MRPFLPILALPLLLALGPTTPPLGPVAPTMKTLQETEPRTPISAATTPGDTASLYIITQPGSYYLTADAKPTAGRNGIRIDADNVTIDLRGFAIDGSSDTTGFRAGITNTAPRRNIAVRNGTIRAMRGYGVIGQFHNSVFEDLALTDSLGGQLEIGASVGTIARKVRTRATSGETGIQLGADALVESCTVEGGGVGITIASGVVRACSVLNPTGTGIFAGAGLVTECYVEGANNTSSITNGGISVSSGARVERCTIRSCASAGVLVSGRSEVVNCQFANCARGVATGLSGRARIEANTFITCTTAISLTGGGNLVVGNRLTGCTNNIALPATPATNAIGEVLDLTAGATLTSTSTHPAANLVY